jgi:hypothetical protein
VTRRRARGERNSERGREEEKTGEKKQEEWEGEEKERKEEWGQGVLQESQQVTTSQLQLFFVVFCYRDFPVLAG